MLDLKDFNYVKFMGNNKTTKAQNIKHLIRDELSNKKYDMETHHRLIRYDSYASNAKFNNTLDFFKHKEEILKPLMVKRFFSNILEKYVVFSKSSNKDVLSEIDLRIYHDMIVNSSTPDFKDNFLSYLMFNIANEQMIFQERNVNFYIFRILSIFENCLESKKRFFDFVGIELEKFMILVWILYVIFMTESKAILRIDKKTFKKNLEKDFIKNISEKEVEVFFEFIAVSKEEFVKKYQFFRQDGNGKLVSYEKLNVIDKFLPRVSYYYPFIKSENNDDFIHLVSYTALEQFIHFERIFEIIINNEIKYRSGTFGDLLEKYIYNLFLYFNKYQTDILNVYSLGNKQYDALKKGATKNYPDVIVEGEEYILFIESKTSGFNLKKVLHDFKKENFKSLQEAIDVSHKNIENFLIYNPLRIDNLSEKKIYKFISFNTVSSTMLTSLHMADFIDTKDFKLIDLSSIELFTHIKDNIKISDVLDEYYECVNDNQKTSNLDHFCMDKFNIDKDDINVKFDKLMNQFIMK